MAGLTSRITKAETAVLGRLSAEWSALSRQSLDIIFAAPEAEHAALVRALKAAGEFENVDTSGVSEPLPGDDELIARLFARMPDGLMERLRAAADAARAAGLE